MKFLRRIRDFFRAPLSSNQPFVKARLEREQEQRESYKLYEGGKHRCTVYGLERTALKSDIAKVQLDGEKQRQEARKRANQVLLGLRDHRLETMDEKAVAEAIEVYKHAPKQDSMFEAAQEHFRKDDVLRRIRDFFRRRIRDFFRAPEQDPVEKELERTLNQSIDNTLLSSNQPFVKARLEREQEQRESYKLYEGGKHRCTVYGLERTALKSDIAKVQLDGEKQRQEARKRANQVLLGLRDHRLETMDEKAVAEAIEVYKHAPIEPPKG